MRKESKAKSSFLLLVSDVKGHCTLLVQSHGKPGWDSHLLEIFSTFMCSGKGGQQAEQLMQCGAFSPPQMAESTAQETEIMLLVIGPIT